MLVAVALTVTLGVRPRIEAREALRKDTANRSAMIVSVDGRRPSVSQRYTASFFTP